MEGARPLAGPLPASGWKERRAGRWATNLVERARGGEPAAFEQIFKRYHQEIYRYCLAILRHPSDAEDALQATMSAALRALPGEGREIELRPWLYRVAYNESISLLRSRTRNPGSDAIEDAPADSAQAEAESRERLRELVADLGGLPERQRGALVMRELSGLSYAEIGAALGSSERAARQIVYEAREALRMRERGRQMDCRQARRAISDGDRRRLRGRKLRAHLSACEGCAEFERAIDRRRDDLQALCPPLPLAAASTVAGGLGAGSGGASLGTTLAASGVGGAGAVGGGLLATASLKGLPGLVAAVVAAVAVGSGGLISPGERAGAERPVVPAGVHGSPAGNGTGAGAAGQALAGSGPTAAGSRAATPPARGKGAAAPAPGRAEPLRSPKAKAPAALKGGGGGRSGVGPAAPAKPVKPAKPPKPVGPAGPPKSSAPPGQAVRPEGAGAGSSSAPGKGGAPSAPAQPPARQAETGKSGQAREDRSGPPAGKGVALPGLPVAGD